MLLRKSQLDEPAADRVVDERRATALMGLPLTELRWFSRLLGVGHIQEIGNTVQIVFTYDELKRLSSEAATSAK
jgi:hypothetical protein